MYVKLAKQLWKEGIPPNLRHIVLLNLSVQQPTLSWGYETRRGDSQGFLSQHTITQLQHNSIHFYSNSNTQILIPLNQLGHKEWVPLLYYTIPQLTPTPSSTQSMSNRKYQLLVTLRIHHCSHSQTCLQHTLLVFSQFSRSPKHKRRSE